MRRAPCRRHRRRCITGASWACTNVRSNQLKQVVLVAAGAVMLCVTTHAATLSDYQHRVANAAATVEFVAGAYEDESYSEPTLIQSRLASVRASLPPKEDVEMGGQRISVDNSW